MTSMRVEVDQSGKMEVLRVDTALALSNGITASILIPAAVKREVYRQLKYRGVKHNWSLANFQNAHILG
ncbi:MAG: hypothetical protein B6I35_05345 [Anaerolineaceae bacterium 4572_32.2]|nr:MAG: hypothetical protein B6I35_05345 [Anaerolineaceae bacterium 4572_32.2]